MASGSLLTLIDDIASLLDDVAAMTKVATRKTAGVLGDDLALNAEQVTGVDPTRELPVVWAVAKGSMLNKAILVPAALLVSALAPWAIGPLLMIGGAYLCYEGFEKITHALLHRGPDPEERAAMATGSTVDVVALEKEKIRGAIRTDFILSAEILVIALGTLGGADISRRIGVLVTLAVLVTVGVYGTVAAIVKLDDLGLALRRRSGGVARAVGGAILRAAPWLMRALSIVGTIAMFLVGGGILVHGIAPLERWFERVIEPTGSVGQAVLPTLAQGVVGLLAGGLLLAIVSGVRQLVSRRTAAEQ